MNKLMVNKDDGNPSWRSFLIDLDLAIKERREKPLGAQAMTGTRASMAIGPLLGEKHLLWMILSSDVKNLDVDGCGWMMLDDVG